MALYGGRGPAQMDVAGQGPKTVVHLRRRIVDGDELRDEQLRGGWGTSPTDVRPTENGGQFIHYDGMAWSPLSSGLNDALFVMNGTGPHDIWAVSNSDGRVAWHP